VQTCPPSPKIQQKTLRTMPHHRESLEKPCRNSDPHLTVEGHSLSRLQSNRWEWSPCRAASTTPPSLRRMRLQLAQPCPSLKASSRRFHYSGFHSSVPSRQLQDKTASHSLNPSSWSSRNAHAGSQKRMPSRQLQGKTGPLPHRLNPSSWSNKNSHSGSQKRVPSRRLQDKTGPQHLNPSAWIHREASSGAGPINRQVFKLLKGRSYGKVYGRASKRMYGGVGDPEQKKGLPRASRRRVTEGEEGGSPEEGEHLLRTGRVVTEKETQEKGDASPDTELGLPQ